MWRRILAYFMFGLGFLVTTYFRYYTGKYIPYPFLNWLVGFIIFLSGFILLRFTPTMKEINAEEKLKKKINYLKASGEKMYVDLNKCEIKEHNYFEEKEKYGHSNELLTLDVEREIQIWNAIGGGSWRNVEQIQVIQSVIIFQVQNQRSGLPEKFISRVIPIDKITLSIYLDKQKQANLYVNKKNRQEYYFDLDFLDSYL